MISTSLDLTTPFNANGKANIDLSGWDYVVVNVIGPGGATFFNTTNDANAITGVSEGNAQTAINWQPVAMTNLANGAQATSTSGTGNFKLNVGAKFFQVTSASTATKVLIQLNKIN
jgi:hypothetical protein